ncbi:MAG: hypothetical protein OEY44_00465 [Candidatus Peregrinibacteria bacterium]|nr:hypothetical protein [Candidatus Peregrinibacteria bacterium]
MKECKQCKSSFEVLPEDREFLDKVAPVFNGRRYDIPDPTFCHLCRMQRRLSFRSERFLYHRKCDLTGKQIISTYSEEAPWPVYNMDDWWSDKWDPMEYGREFDFSRPFFEQFFELRDSVPRQALIQQKPMENSEYCNAASRNKNCYLVFSTNRCEDCYYGSWVNGCKNCIDSLNNIDCELCYECVSCRGCYNVRYSIDSSNCKNSAFLRACTGVSDSFGCSNLVNKQYYIFNKPYPKEEYEKFMAEVDLGSHETVEKIKARIEDELSDLVVKENMGVNNENCLGNYLRNCRNCYKTFECDNSEDLRYCIALEGANNCMDQSHWGVGAQWNYEVQASGYNVDHIMFSNLVWDQSSDVMYSDHCTTSKNLFGCVGLRTKKYCIFNTQYTKEEYMELVPKIIEHMKKTGEWGEFFPTAKSLYAYNETLAYEQFKLSKEAVLKRGWRWKDKESKLNYKGPKYEIPDHIKDVENDIIGKILTSEKSGEPYKLIPQEFEFYKRNNIPIPRLTPDERHWERLSKRNLRYLYDRQCVKCSKAITTTYSPDRHEQVYCEQCYLKEVY